MGKLIDLTGQRFGRLTVLDVAEYKGRLTTWRCKCDCGNEKIVRGDCLRYGLTKSCGCIQKEARTVKGKGIKDLTGKRFGRLTVLERMEDGDRRAKWLCKCDCGRIKIVASTNLIQGNTVSCGCLNRENQTTHGKSKTRLYRIYNNMKNRCYNSNVKAFPDYGGRGIKVCDEWLADFMNFYNWAMTNGYDDTKSIDRIDNDGSYEPSNCRWVGLKAQQNNKRSNIMLEYKGKTKTVAEWADEVGIPRGIVYDRIKKGWTTEEALTTPKGEKRRST